MAELLRDPLIIGVVILLAIVGIIYLILENQHKFAFKSFLGGGSDDSVTESADNPLAEILYLYDHESEKHWLKWIVKQDAEIQAEALKRLVDHIQGPSKHWGYITLEVLEVLQGFKDKGVEENLGAFFKEVGKLWGEYKSLPNYYEKAASVLININPQFALKVFGEEFDRKAGTQSTEERKKIIMDSLPQLNDMGTGMLISILKDNEESSEIKMYALNTARKLERESLLGVVLEALKHQVSRFNIQSKDVKATEIQLIQEILKEVVTCLSQQKFFKVIQSACEAPRLGDEVINSLIDRLKNESISTTAIEAYAMTLLKDDSQNTLRKALASAHNLDENEITNICMAPISKCISEKDLKHKDLKEDQLSIPEPFKAQYDVFRDLFFQPQSSSNGLIASCEKSYGGILLAGNNEQEKLYFAKTFAQEKAHNFGYIDLSSVVDKETYGEVVSIFSSLRKPYILFIDNPELMYPSDNSMVSSYREKFSQTLYIQSMDTKSLLVGSIHKSSEELQEDDGMQYSITKLRTKFFAQTMDINIREERFKLEIIEGYLKYISSSRLDNRNDLIHEMIELSKEKSFLEFAFFVVSAFATMLMVYGNCVSYDEIRKLEATFNSIELSSSFGSEDSYENIEEDYQENIEEDYQEELEEEIS